MTVRHAHVDDVRAAARALGTSAARCGRAARQVGQACGAVPSWQGGHAVVWATRGRQVGAAARELERDLHDAATAVELYAAALQSAQDALRRLDAEADVLRAVTRRALQQWALASGADRGPRPDAAAALAALDRQRQAVEERAERDAQVFAGRLSQSARALGRSPSVASVLRALLDSEAYTDVYVPVSAALDLGVTGVTALGRAVPAVGALGAQLPRLPQLPPGLRVPGRVLGPVGVLTSVADDVRTVRKPDAPGGRDDADRIVAGVGLVGAGAAGAAMVASAIGAGAVVTALAPGLVGVAVLTGGYALGAWAWDRHRRSTPAARTRPPRAPAPRSPAPSSPSPVRRTPPDPGAVPQQGRARRADLPGAGGPSEPRPVAAPGAAPSGAAPVPGTQPTAGSAGTG